MLVRAPTHHVIHEIGAIERSWGRNKGGNVNVALKISSERQRNQKNTKETNQNEILVDLFSFHRVAANVPHRNICFGEK